MVAQWDSKPPADIGQPGRVDAPLRARKPDRTGERQSRHTNSVPGATRLEHAPVKTRVVSRDELRLVEPGEQGGPEFAKGGCVADVFPAETMDPGELEPGFRRSDQEGPHSLNASVAPPRKADRARTVRLMIGGLESIATNEFMARYHTGMRKLQGRSGELRPLQSRLEQARSRK